MAKYPGSSKAFVNSEYKFDIHRDILQIVLLELKKGD